MLCFHEDEASVWMYDKNESKALHIDIGSRLSLFEVVCMDFKQKPTNFKTINFRIQTGQFSGNWNLSPLEAEFGKSQNCKVVEN